MPKISVIIPVYKVELLLHRCLKSLINQTFVDWECILIDDGSPDCSGQICDGYKKDDNRFIVVHTENHGASEARNLGISLARGEWTCFIDSDDWVENLYLEHLVTHIDNNIDMVLTNYSSHHYIKENSSKSHKDMVDYMIAENLFAMSGPYAKLFKTCILKQESIRFPKGIHMGEDAIFNTLYMQHVNRILFLTYDDYHYDQREGSLSCKYYGLNGEYQCFKQWRDAEYLLFKRFYSSKEALELVWKVRISAQFKRVYQGIFKTDKQKSFCTYLSELKGIDATHINEYAKYGIESNFAGKIQKFLITHKLFRILTFLELIIFKDYVNN